MSDRPPRFVFFDAGETLVHPLPSFPGLFSRVCAEHGLEVDFSHLPKVTRALMGEVEEKQRHGYTFTNDASESRRFWLDFYGTMVRSIGYDEEDGVLPQALYRTFSDPVNYGAYEDVGETFTQLRELGVRMGLISNFESWLEELLDNLGLLEFLEVVVISGSEDYEKPHPKIYELALKRGGVPPGDALHVGDSPISDYDGARAAGIRAVLLDRWDRYPEFEGERVKDLRELPGLLERGERGDG